MQHLARARPGNTHGRPLVGDGSHRHAQFGPDHLQQKLQMAHHLGRLRGGGGHEKLGFTDARSGAVVHDDTVLAQHKSVARFTYGQFGISVHIDAVQELGGVWALYINLAQGGGIGNAHALAHKVHLGFVGLGQRGAVRAVPQGAQPVARFQLDAAVGQMPVVHGGQALGLEVAAHIAPGQCAQRRWGVGRAEGGGAGQGHIHAARSSHHAHAIEVGGFALVRTHAQRGVALQVLYRHIAFAVRQLHISDRHIVLKIDKGFAAGCVRAQRPGRHKGHAKALLQRGRITAAV